MEEYIEMEEFNAGAEDSYTDTEVCSTYVNDILDSIQDSLDY